MFASDKLIEEHVYTRNMLQEMFAITDATLRNGVFRLAEYQSIWLFVTEQKSKDIPQLYDLLDGDILRWDGQPEGRTDKYIIGHEAECANCHGVIHRNPDRPLSIDELRSIVKRRNILTDT